MNTPHPLSRREAVARMLAAAATISLLDFQAFGVPGLPTSIGTDPNLRAKIIPWERVLSEAEMKTVTALCDVIIPADDKSPAASAVGVPTLGATVPVSPSATVTTPAVNGTAEPGVTVRFGRPTPTIAAGPVATSSAPTGVRSIW